MKHRLSTHSRINLLCSKPRQRRGAMIVLIAMMMIVFIVTTIFSVDVAYMQLTQTKMRTATDAAARAGGEALSRTQDIALARQAAKNLASKNLIAGQPLVLEDEEIVFGNASMRDDESWAFSPGDLPINSVRVNSKRTTDSSTGNVSLFFAPLLGVDYFEPTQTSTAMRLDRDICLVVDRSTSMKEKATSKRSNNKKSKKSKKSKKTKKSKKSSSKKSSSKSDDDDDDDDDSRRGLCAKPSKNSRWAALVSAVETFVGALDETPESERVALVSYASSITMCKVTNHVSDLDQPLTDNTSLILSALEVISKRKFNGQTNIAAGIDLGITALVDSPNSRPFAQQTMVLLTDGLVTNGRSPVLAAQDAKARGIVIHSITFGDSADKALMEKVAGLTGGKHYHAPDAYELKKIFNEIALATQVIFID